MKVVLYEEELTQCTPDLVTSTDGQYVGVQFGVSEFNGLTLWFDSPTAREQFFSNIVTTIHGG